MKSMVYIGATIGGIVGGGLGAMIDSDHSGFGAWSIILGAVGGFVGIWLGYRISQDM